MYLDAGIGAILAAAILHAWAHRMHHRADAPDWAKTQKFATLTGVVVAVLIPLGTGWVAVGGRAILDAVGVAGWLALLAAPLVLLIVGPWLAARMTPGGTIPAPTR